jgi:hypothetical protein
MAVLHWIDDCQNFVAEWSAERSSRDQARPRLCAGPVTVTAEVVEGWVARHNGGGVVASLREGGRLWVRQQGVTERAGGGVGSEVEMRGRVVPNSKVTRLVVVHQVTL